MAVSRANLIGGPGKVTWNSATFFFDGDLSVDFGSTLQDLNAGPHGRIDKVRTDRMVKVNGRLWGDTGSIATLFPSTILNPVVGTRIFGTSDLPLIVHKSTGSAERITIHNAQLTGLPSLYLGVDNNFFAADVEFTGLLKNSTNPEAANSYYTVDTSAYSDTTFAKTNFNRQRWSAAWGASPFDSFQAHKGWNLGWEYSLEPEYNANVGTVDFILTGFNASAECIPLGPTVAQIDARLGYQGTGNALGTLISNTDDDLVLTGTAPAMVITMKGASLVSWKPGLSSTSLLNGTLRWETTRGFSSGTAAALATFA